MPPNNTPAPESGDGNKSQWFDPRELRKFDTTNDPNSIIGRRWLCKSSSMMIVGQSGTGKSSLMMQFAVRWAVGKDAFGIKPKEPLRSIILNAENDFGDCAEAYQGAVQGADLTDDQLDVLDANLAIVRNTTSMGEDFATYMESLIRQHNASIIWVDPLLAFAGFDISNQKETSAFLRRQIHPILKATGCILCFMHHTTKPKKENENEQTTIASMAYQGAGSAEFVNYVREVCYLMKTSGDDVTYKFGLTKRRGRAGLKNRYGEFRGEILIRHSTRPGVIAWEYAEDDQGQSKDPSPSNGKGSPRRYS